MGPCFTATLLTKVPASTWNPIQKWNKRIVKVSKIWTSYQWQDAQWQKNSPSAKPELNSLVASLITKKEHPNATLTESQIPVISCVS